MQKRCPSLNDAHPRLSKGLEHPLTLKMVISKFLKLVMLEALNNVGCIAQPGYARNKKNIPLKVASKSMKLRGGHV